MISGRNRGPDGLRAHFDEVLQDVVLNGTFVAVGEPFRWYVVDALDKITLAFPGPSDDLIVVVRQKLEQQIGEEWCRSGGQTWSSPRRHSGGESHRDQRRRVSRHLQLVD